MSRVVSTASSGSVTNEMLRLRPRAIWHALLASPWSFRWTCMYVFWEYVRPQSIYTFLQGVPWSRASIILAMVAFVAEGARFRSRTILNVSLLAFSMIALASSLTAEYPDVALNQLPIYWNWVVAFALIANTATTERRWFLFIVLFLLWSFKMSQHGAITWIKRGFSFASWGVSGSPGWFQNSGEFALQMGIFVPFSIYFILAVKPHVSKLTRWALWAMPVTGVFSVIASSSRGGQLALALVALVAVSRGKKRVRNMVGLAVMAPLLWMITPAEQKARFQTAGEDDTSQQRQLFWKRGLEMAAERPVLGIGYGNWIPAYKARYYVPGDTLNRFDTKGQLRVLPAHNSFVEVVSELGYTGLLVFVWLLCAIFVVNMQTRKVLQRIGPRGRFLELMSRGLDDGVIAFSVAGFFMSVAFYPFVWFQLAMTAALHTAARQLVDSQRVVETVGEPFGMQPATNRPSRMRKLLGNRRPPTAGPRQPAAIFRIRPRPGTT